MGLVVPSTGIHGAMPANKGKKVASGAKRPAAGISPAKSSPEIDRLLRKTCIDLIQHRSQGSTICPSVCHAIACWQLTLSKEIPRYLAAHPAAGHGTDFRDWRRWMDAAREQVWKLVEDNVVEVTQRGVVRTVAERENLKGPLRVRRGKKWLHAPVQ